MKSPASVKTVKRILKGVDLETHVRVVNLEGMEIVELIDFIPSLGEYGRGYYLPNDTDRITELIGALLEVVDA